jgi:hypothetical protein
VVLVGLVAGVTVGRLVQQTLAAVVVVMPLAVPVSLF